MSYLIRQHHNQRITAKQTKLWLQYNNGKSTLTAKRVGKMRKQKALNCGVAGCMWCCNPRRNWGRLTIHEISANERYKEMEAHIGVGFGEGIDSEDTGVGAGISDEYDGI